jgi:hypothetical protein
MKRLVTNMRVALSADGSLWAVAPGHYILERWDPQTGKKLQRVDVASTWFKDSDVYDADERTRPVSVIEGVWEDEQGLVWLLIRASDADWRPPARANIERIMDDAEYNATYDWIIEVVEPGTARVLASTRVPDVLWYRGPAPLLLSPVDSDSLVIFDVLRARLREDAQVAR